MAMAALMDERFVAVAPRALNSNCEVWAPQTLSCQLSEKGTAGYANLAEQTPERSGWSRCRSADRSC